MYFLNEFGSALRILKTQNKTQTKNKAKRNKVKAFFKPGVGVEKFYSDFPFSSKINISKFQFDQE